MTMLSFRVGDDDALAVARWAERLGMDRSELLRDALHHHLLRLAAERDAETWQRFPLTIEEQALDAIEEWEPAEDWSDWADAAPLDAAPLDAAPLDAAPLDAAR